MMHTAIADDRLIDRAEAAEILGIAPQTLAVWAMTGRYLHVIKIGRRVKYRLSDVYRLIETSTAPVTR